LLFSYCEKWTRMLDRIWWEKKRNAQKMLSKMLSDRANSSSIHRRHPVHSDMPANQEK
jgi:hypothetical protein